AILCTSKRPDMPAQEESVGKFVLLSALNRGSETGKAAQPVLTSRKRPKKQKNVPQAKKMKSAKQIASDEVVLPAMRHSDDPPPLAKRWMNKQRVLIFATRGITHLHRHLMEDLRNLLPHSKKEAKKDKNEALSAINEICEMKNCSKSIFFEARRKRDLYAWLSNVPGGPSAKFQVENIHTMAELKLTGNCLRGSRALLTFSENFESSAHGKVLKELISQVFNTPRFHPHSQPFIDHVFVFSYLDEKIWFRNYEINEESGALNEIGPRFVLNPIKIFDGSFCGKTLWENSKYRTPGFYRRMLGSMTKYDNRVMTKAGREVKQRSLSFPVDEAENVFG
ncbi:unnamed protein product, partial [Notodromas monacha]